MQGGAAPSILVVGAGPAGATLAYLLASRGIRVTLLERQRNFSREFRGEVLLPSGLEALEQAGLGEIFAGVPQSAPAGIELYADAKPVFRLAIDSEFVGPRGPTAFSQPAFLEAVIRAAQSFPGFRVELGAGVRELVYEDGRVVGVRVGGESRESELRADLVIGADGRASAVRRRGGFRARSQGLEVDVVWFKVPLPDFFSEAAPVRVYIGRAHLLIAYRAADGMLQVAWVITKGTYGQLRRRGVEEWVDEISDHVTQDLAAHLRRHSRELTHPFLLSAVSDRVEHWYRPGVLLIGDAAHTMSPVGGQGINIALRDAVVAANHLVPLLKQGADPEGIDRAARAIEAERTPEVVGIQRMQSAPPRVLMGHVWWSATLREILPRLLRLPFVRARAARVARVILFGLGDVRLKV
jgi:2-polyprenyl-6-methoxyphenol hydroxylase-like FAD-dependent oxidoreductase